MQTTGDALLQAILDEPDDDGLRLIYADWLHDHGDPDRAEFIRLEIAMAPRLIRKNVAPNEWDDPEYHRLARRRDELVERHAGAWFAGLDELTRAFTTRRGFVDHVNVTARTFAERADELFALAPLVSRMYLVRLGKHLPAVARRPELARLREIGFVETTLASAGVRALCRSPHLRHLRVSDAVENRIGADGARAVADSAGLASLGN
jgi:uncharacterized protein (TIGR02996 family)